MKASTSIFNVKELFLLYRYLSVRQNSSNLLPIQLNFEVDSSSICKLFRGWLEHALPVMSAGQTESVDRCTKNKLSKRNHISLIMTISKEIMINASTS